jgi:hypothetical protein
MDNWQQNSRSVLIEGGEHIANSETRWRKHIERLNRSDDTEPDASILLTLKPDSCVASINANNLTWPTTLRVADPCRSVLFTEAWSMVVIPSRSKNNSLLKK